MKKIISVLLVVLAVFSLTATAAFAEGETTKPITVYFYDDNSVEPVKTIYVNYGEDLNVQAPEFESYVIEASDGTSYKIVHDGWEITNLKGYNGEFIPKGNLPVFGENDKVTEVHIRAQYEAYENNIQNNVQDALENIPGGEIITNASDFFSSIISLIKTWFMNFILFLNAFK